MADTQDLEPLLNTQQSQLDLVLSDATAIDNKSLAILASNIALCNFYRTSRFKSFALVDVCFAFTTANPLASA